MVQLGECPAGLAQPRRSPVGTRWSRPLTASRSLRRQPPPEGLPRRPRRDSLRHGGLHQPALLPHRGSAQQARPRREVPGAARLPRPATQRPRREGGGAQPGAAAPLVGLRRAALPARGEAAGSGGVPAAPPHDGDRRREAAAAAASAGGRRARCGRLTRARRRILRDAPGEGLPARMRLRPAPSGYLTTLKCHSHTLHSACAALARLRSEKLKCCCQIGCSKYKRGFLTIMWVWNYSRRHVQLFLKACY